MLMFGFGGLGFAAFSVGMKVGQIAEAAWWKGKLQEALTSTREPPPPRQMSLVRERQELGESPLRPGSLLRRPPHVVGHVAGGDDGDQSASARRSPAVI
jgi:hypothetical protein